MEGMIRGRWPCCKIRGEKNIEREYKLILGAQKAHIADADSTRISKVVVQFKYCVRIK